MAERNQSDGEAEALEEIAEMEPPYRTIAERLHEIVTATPPELTPKTWYGIPAYSNDGTVVCSFHTGGGT